MKLVAVFLPLLLASTGFFAQTQSTEKVPPRPTAPPKPKTSSGTSQAEIAFWTSIKDSTDPADFEAYLKKFPEGLFVDLARNKIKALTTQAAEPIPLPTTSVLMPTPMPTNTPTKEESGIGSITINLMLRGYKDWGSFISTAGNRDNLEIGLLLAVDEKNVNTAIGIAAAKSSDLIFIIRGTKKETKWYAWLNSIDGVRFTPTLTKFNFPAATGTHTLSATMVRRHPNAANGQWERLDGIDTTSFDFQVKTKERTSIQCVLDVEFEPVNNGWAGVKNTIQLH